jgi:ADP-ribose pyrophosphatase YjhB (NUDIX family)
MGVGVDQALIMHWWQASRKFGSLANRKNSKDGQRMNFCSHCGARVELKIPEGDQLPRHVCPSCGTIHYQNPKMVVGCIPEWEDKVLLCRRAIEPKYGLWTLPAGFMENGETTAEGALRETWEEAGARIEMGPLYTLFNLPHINQVYFMFRARLLDLDYQPGTESLEVRLFAEHEIPWDEIAFRTVKASLELYFQDRKNGGFGLHVGDIRPPAETKT